MQIGVSAELSASRRRRALQIIFVFVNLALVEAHLPGPLWLAIGGVFWIGLIAITAAGSSLVCGTMCWVGAIQDFAEPVARSRVRIDPRFGRALTLLLLLAWIPLGWFLWPSAAAHDATPLDLNPASWPRHLFGLGIALAIPPCVMVLGKRGICRYLCPFNSFVALVRRGFERAKASLPPAVPECSSARQSCSGCARATPRPLQHLEPKG